MWSQRLLSTLANRRSEWNRGKKPRFGRLLGALARGHKKWRKRRKQDRHK